MRDRERERERERERGREREREAETQAEGEAGSMQGAQCGARSRDSGIMPWAKSRHSTTEQPRCPRTSYYFFIIKRFYLFMRDIYLFPK